MWEFLQANGYWIALGVFLVVMVRMHAGGGCGMGHGDHQQRPGSRQRPPAEDSEADEANAGTAGQPTTRRSGGCH